MKKILIVISLFSLSTASFAGGSNYTGNVNLFVGMKSMSDEAWESSSIENHANFGILIDLKEEHWPVSITADLLRSSDSNDGLKGRTTECNLGITKHWEKNGFSPYIGGGIAFINADVSLGSSNADETEVGVWGKAGIFTTLEDGTNLGIEIRQSFADADFNGNDIEIGGFHAGFFVGYHW